MRVRFEDGEFQNAHGAAAGDLSSSAAEMASRAAASSVGSLIKRNSSRSSASSTTLSGGSPLFFPINSSGVAGTPTGIQPTTSIASVSATR
jgi:hypothetical protein